MKLILPHPYTTHLDGFYYCEAIYPMSFKLYYYTDFCRGLYYNRYTGITAGVLTE